MKIILTEILTIEKSRTYVPYMLMIYFSMNMDRAGANADCYSMLERNENWIEDWFETDPDSKGKRY